MAEPLHDEFDVLQLPFRSRQAELVERFSANVEDDTGRCRLPMSQGFVASQIGALWFKPNRKRIEQPPGILRGEAADFAEAVADLATRFGDALVEESHDPGKDPATKASWQVGTQSQLVVTASSILKPGETGPCTLAIFPNYVRPHDERERAALASFTELYSHASSSFGWTEFDGRNLLMRVTGGNAIELIEPSDIVHVVVEEAHEARSHAFSAISCKLLDGSYLLLASSEPGRFEAIGRELASQLGTALVVNEGPST